MVEADSHFVIKIIRAALLAIVVGISVGTMKCRLDWSCWQNRAPFGNFCAAKQAEQIFIYKPNNNISFIPLYSLFFPFQNA
jgi:hypothetical protein